MPINGIWAWPPDGAIVQLDGRCDGDCGQKLVLLDERGSDVFVGAHLGAIWLCDQCGGPFDVVGGDVPDDE